MIAISFILGFITCLCFVSLMNYAIRLRVAKGEKLINYGAELLAQKEKLTKQLNELQNG
jgi:uncharacterized membrane protein YciS (DUF1049 family)